MPLVSESLSQVVPKAVSSKAFSFLVFSHVFLHKSSSLTTLDRTMQEQYKSGREHCVDSGASVCFSHNSAFLEIFTLDETHLNIVIPKQSFIIITCGFQIIHGFYLGYFLFTMEKIYIPSCLLYTSDAADE